MNIENIVEYINKTPGNTNPSVVASMVQSILSNSIDQFGYCIAWDGDTSNRDKLTIEGLTGDSVNEGADFMVNFYKVSNSVLSSNQLINGQLSLPQVMLMQLRKRILLIWEMLLRFRVIASFQLSLLMQENIVMAISL